MNISITYNERHRGQYRFPTVDRPATGHFEIECMNGLLAGEDGQERIRHFEISWFKTGTGELLIDSKRYPVLDNSVFYLMPGQMRDWRIEAVSGYRLSFSQEFLDIVNSSAHSSRWMDCFDCARGAQSMEADAVMQEDMELIIQKMQRELANYYLLRAEIVSGLLNILLIHLSRKMGTVSHDVVLSKDGDLVRRFKKLLQEHFTNKKQVSDYASELCVTPNYLNRTIKKLTGLTASHHIQQQIILEAKRQAIHMNVSMKEIAYSLGFDNLAHFSKFFKNNSGMSFSNFKKERALV